MYKYISCVTLQSQVLGTSNSALLLGVSECTYSYKHPRYDLAIDFKFNKLQLGACLLIAIVAMHQFCVF
jgi:hypothetical protein